jgi:hypothetical protein
MKNMFFWCGIMLFDTSLKQYGGYNHWIAKIFRDKYWYLAISLHWQFNFKYTSTYYDGTHNMKNFGFITIAYGT